MTQDEYKKLKETVKITYKQINNLIKNSKMKPAEKKFAKFCFQSGLLIGKSSEKADNDMYITKVGNEIQKLIKQICVEGGIPVPLDIAEKVSISSENADKMIKVFKSK